jgi:Uma2 family endonuclease
MTADEFLAFVSRPENEDRWFELVRGEVVAVPLPGGPRYGFVYAALGYCLHEYARGTGRHVVQSNRTGVILARDPDTVRGPDVALYDADDSEWESDGWNERPPRLAVEVRFFSTPDGFHELKVADYTASGVPLVWLIDPDAHTLTVHRPRHAPMVLTSEQEVTGGDALPGPAFRVDDLFRLPAERGHARSPT